MCFKKRKTTLLFDKHRGGNIRFARFSPPCVLNAFPRGTRFRPSACRSALEIDNNRRTRYVTRCEKYQSVFHASSVVKPWRYGGTARRRHRVTAAIDVFRRRDNKNTRTDPRLNENKRTSISRRRSSVGTGRPFETSCRKSRVRKIRITKRRDTRGYRTVYMTCAVTLITIILFFSTRRQWFIVIKVITRLEVLKYQSKHNFSRLLGQNCVCVRACVCLTVWDRYCRSGFQAHGLRSHNRLTRCEPW